MRRILSLVVLGIALACGTVPARAGDEGPPDAQKPTRERVQPIVDRYRPRLNDLKIQIQQVRAELARKLGVRNPDGAELKALIDRLMDLERQRQHLILDQFLETLKVLDPEEQSRYVERFREDLLR